MQRRSALAVTGLAHTGAKIPPSHLDLVECPPVAALTTVGADGYPQTTVVWCDYVAPHVRVNTMRGFAKERNVRRDPRATLLCYDPARPGRYLEIRGDVVELTEEDATEHLDALASKYLGRSVRYFGDVVASELSATEIPVLISILPIQVNAMDAAAHAPRVAPR